MQNLNENSQVPPYSNRGAQNTKQVGLVACVDWLQATFHDVTNKHEIIALLGIDLDKFEDMQTGQFGYSNRLFFGNISLYYSDDKDSVHLVMTGQGCRTFEDFSNITWSVLFEYLTMIKVTVSRFDLAIDDFEGYFKISTIYRKLRSGHARSKFKEFRFMVKQKIAEKEITGQTVYLGSPASRLMIRFYDKLAERKSKHYEVADGITCWNRTELQMRDERAMAAVTLLANPDTEIGEITNGILKNYITFINPTKQKNGKIDLNKSRWKVAEFWTKFLGDCEKIKLTQRTREKNIVTTKAWFENAITPTLYMLLKAFDFDMGLLQEWLESGKNKLSDRHEMMLKEFQEYRKKFNEDMELKRGLEKKKLLEPKKYHEIIEFIKKDSNLKKQD